MSNLALPIFWAVSFFSVIIFIYSLGSIRRLDYYFYLILTWVAASGVLFAGDYITLMIFWGLMGIPLYLLVSINNPTDGSAAKKTLLMVGGADAVMLVGVAIVWLLTGSVKIGAMPLQLNNPLTIIAFVTLMAGAFAKAGVMPLHSWIPDAAEVAPSPVMALLPASLDKLVGIYLIVRLCFDAFILVPNSAISIILMTIGALTIIIAVLGALVQHDFKKLLSFHAVSQVGYMVLGIGTGLPLGVAGGIFHMFNHAIYKSCLFLCSGSVENKTGTTDLDQLGGLGRLMPLTFGSFLIAAFSISGVPPFNGFASKWLIYQALVEFGRMNQCWIIFLAAAMFGSAFTLASFMKLIHAVFLGQSSPAAEKVNEVHFTMWLPPVILATLCVVIGLGWPFLGIVPPLGHWAPGIATGVLSVSLLVGLLVYLIGGARLITSKPVFIGGVALDPEVTKVSGTDFYETVNKWGILKVFYPLAAKKYFGLYEIMVVISLSFSRALSYLHSGLLRTYLIWCLLGFLVLAYILVK